VRLALDDVDPPQRPLVEPVVQSFVQDRIRCMPAHLRAGVTLAELLLRLSTMGRPDLPTEASWQWHLPPVRDYIRLVRSLVVFAAAEASSPPHPAPRFAGR